MSLHFINVMLEEYLDLSEILIFRRCPSKVLIKALREVRVEDYLQLYFIQCAVNREVLKKLQKNLVVEN